MVNLPSVVAAAADVLVPRELEWRPCRLANGEVYRLRATIEGTSDELDRAAAIVFEGAGSGLGLSRGSVGPQIRLHTGFGLNRVDRLFTVDSNVSRFGLRTVDSPNNAVIRALTIERVEPESPGTDYFLSFDVEERAGEFLAKPLDERVWCKTAHGEYGIRRICAILDEHGLTGNFLIDFASCAREGEGRLRDVVDFLLGWGHEVHARLHANKVALLWGVTDDSKSTGGWDYHQLRRAVDYTARTFERFVGRPPRVLRSDRHVTGPELVLAAGSVGIEALSNAHVNLGDPAFRGDPVVSSEPFTWENGVVEIPVDVASPERGSLETFVRRRDDAVLRKATHRTCTVVMHSRSLLRVDADEPDPDHIERFRGVCDVVAQQRVWGFGEYLDHRGSVPGWRRLSVLEPASPLRDQSTQPTTAVTCNVCDTTFRRDLMRREQCPSCASSPGDRQVRFVSDTYGLPLDGSVVASRDADEVQSRGLDAVSLPGLDPVLGIVTTVHVAAKPAEVVRD